MKEFASAKTQQANRPAEQGHKSMQSLIKGIRQGNSPGTQKLRKNASNVREDYLKHLRKTADSQM